MQLKETTSADVSITPYGTIAIQQWDNAINEPVFVYLTLEQFRGIQRWVDNNEQNIVAAWNGGVDDGEG